MTVERVVTSRDFRGFSARLTGYAAHRDDPEYAAMAVSRFPNPLIRWAAAGVVRPSTVQDVQAAVRFAGEHGLPIAVRGGGVGSSGSGQDSLLIDLRDLNAVTVDPARRRVTMQGGAVWQDVSRELARNGLAAAAPQFPRLGIGHVLGGGHGWLSGRLGWASDTIRAVDVVTADGQVVRAHGDRDSQLFWALRGAGANFGVAVNVELEVIPLQQVTFGIVWFHPDRTAESLTAFREWVTVQPDEVTAIGSLGMSPSDGPTDLAGRPAVHALICHCGPSDQADRDLASLRQQPAVVADSTRRLPWAELAVGNDVFPSGVRRRWRMHYLRDFDDQVIDITSRRAAGLGPLDFMSTHYYGGRLRRTPEDSTAMSHRDKPWNYMVSMTWTDSNRDPERIAWHDDYLAELAPLAHDSYYVNYLFAERNHIRAAYNPRTWTRLLSLKQHWDPENLFRNNQNIKPD